MKANVLSTIFSLRGKYGGGNPCGLVIRTVSCRHEMESASRHLAKTPDCSSAAALTGSAEMPAARSRMQALATKNFMLAEGLMAEWLLRLNSLGTTEITGVFIRMEQAAV